MGADMETAEKQTHLKRNLGLLDVFSIAAGAMISSGLFVLPALASQQAGPSMIVSYVIASVLVLPSLLSKAELATAMPKAGGTFFYVHRSLGGLWGLFCGLADWFSLAMKCAFAVLGIALFVRFGCETLLGITLNSAVLKMIAVLCCLFFAGLNLSSVKHTARFQNCLVAFLLVTLVLFTLVGFPRVNVLRYTPFAPYGVLQLIATAGMVFVSYGGLDKVTTIAEEIKHPARNIPYGMLLAWSVVSFLYVAVVFITAGVLDAHILNNSEAPVSVAAGELAGAFGFWLLSFAAMAAFITTANGGLLAASRSPLAMSRDHLLPAVLARVNKRFRTPHWSILLTCGFMITAIVFLELELLVKTASTMMILLFMLDNASVIIMRESKLQGYRPPFKAPLYPWLQTAAIMLYILLLIDMGRIPLLISGGFLLFSAVWYWLFASNRIKRDSAVMRLVERVTDKTFQTETLENELRDILLERDNIIEDRFDKLIQQCEILDLHGPQQADTVFQKAATVFADRLDLDEQVLFEKFRQREAEGSTVLEPGLAIPHIIIEGQQKFDIITVRAADGIAFPHAAEPVKTVFFLAGTKDERNYHLRALMAIAQTVQEKDFYARWFAARDAEALRNLMLLSKRKRETA
jgi:APA family basic amino acid/polyamine antiporter